MLAVKNLALGAIVAAGMTFGFLPAMADTVGDSYQFSFSFGAPSSGTTMDGSGTFVARYEGGSDYLLQSISGSVDNSSIGPSSQSITGLSPYAAADNTLFFPGPPLVDFGGISFATGYEDYNIYWNGYYGVLESSLNSVGYPNGIQVTFSVGELGPVTAATATPLPGTLALFLGGLSLLIGSGLWKRREVCARARRGAASPSSKPGRSVSGASHTG